MKVAIINDASDTDNAARKNIDMYVKTLEHNKVGFEVLSINDVDFFGKIRNFSHVIYRWSHYDGSKQSARSLLPVLENELRLKCFPDQKTCWHYDNKIRQALIMKAKGLPFAESWVFYDKAKALDFVASASYPVIFKLSGGAGSTNVVMVETRAAARKLVKIMFGRGMLPHEIPGDIVKKRDFKFIKWLKITLVHTIIPRLKGIDTSRYWFKHKNYVLFQKFLPNNAFDTRVTVIGGRAFAFRRFNRDNDFRSSGSGKINYDMQAIDKNMVRLALDISKEMGFQSMAYDMLVNEHGKPEFCEISYTYQDTAIYNCPGYWDEELGWHAGHFWPPYLHLRDLLGVELKQPDSGQ